MALEIRRTTRCAILALLAALAATSLLGCISHERMQEHVEQVQRTLSNWGVSMCDTMVHHTVDKLEEGAMTMLQDPNHGICRNLMNVDGCLNEGAKEIHLRAQQRLAFWNAECTGFVSNVTQNIFDYNNIQVAVDTFHNDVGPKMKEEVQAFLDLGMEHVKELYKNAPKLKEKHNFKIAGVKNDTLNNIQEGLQKAGKQIETGFQGVSDWFHNMTDSSKSEPPTAPVRKYEADIKAEAGSTAASSPWPLIACCSAFAFVGFGVSTACARRQGSAWGSSVEETETDMEANAEE